MQDVTSAGKHRSHLRVRREWSRRTRPGVKGKEKGNSGTGEHGSKGGFKWLPTWGWWPTPSGHEGPRREDGKRKIRADCDDRTDRKRKSKRRQLGKEDEVKGEKGDLERGGDR